MRIPVWGFLPALAFLSLPLRAEESQAPQPIPIAVVKTWGELRRQPALKLEGDAGTVRLGLEAASGPQGSQPLLYALVETMRSDLRLLDLDDCPLNLRVQIPGAIIVESKQNADRLRGSDYPELARCLFAQPIPIAAVGTHAIQLRDPLGQVLAQGAVKGRMELDHAWSAFEPPTEEEERLEATESLVESVSLSRRGAAYPSLPLHALMMEAQFKGGKWETNVTDQELLPSLHLSAPQQEALAPFEPRMEERLARLFDGLGDSAYETREQAELDLRALGPAIKARLKTEAERTQDPEVGVRLGRLLARWAPQLTVSFDGGLLSLRFRAPQPMESACSNFLARWWLNGKPIQLAANQKFVTEDGGLMRALLTYRDAQLKLRWDPASLGVQPGDVVEVEVLYCPYGWMFPDELSEGWEAYYDAGFETPSFPFCSNRARYVFPRQAEAKP